MVKSASQPSASLSCALCLSVMLSASWPIMAGTPSYPRPGGDVGDVECRRLRRIQVTSPHRRSCGTGRINSESPRRSWWSRRHPLCWIRGAGAIVTDGFQRPVEGYIHGEHGRIVVVPGRVAAWLEKRCNLNQLRISVRGCDSEVDSVLMAVHLAALEWRSAATGTETAASAEPTATSEAWVTTTQAAGLLGISDRAVRKAIAEGRIAATRVGNAWRIAREDLEHYRAARKVA